MKDNEILKDSGNGARPLLPAVPIRIQRSRQHKQVSPNGLPIVYVGRPSKWGNMFVVTGEDGHWFVINKDEGSELFATFNQKHEAIQVAIDCYRRVIQLRLNVKEINLSELKGKNLACWCPLDCKCHADVLLELANREGHGR